MAGAGHILYFFEIISLALVIIAVILLDQLCDFFLVVLAHKLPDHFLGYVATDVLVVVALALDLLLFDILEYLQTSAGLFGHDLIGLAVGLDDNVVRPQLRLHRQLPDQRTISIWHLVRMGQQSAQKGVSRSTTRYVQEECPLIFVHAFRVFQVNLLLLFLLDLICRVHFGN